VCAVRQPLTLSATTSAPDPAPGGVRALVGSVDDRLGGLSGGVLRLEDVAIAGWLVVALPIIRTAAGPGSDSAAPLASDRDLLSGLLWLSAVLLAIAVVATRSPGDPVIGFEDMSTPRSYAPLPFLLSLAIVSDTAMRRLGLDSGALTALVFIVTMVAYVAAPHLPNLPRTTRRLMILPIILIAADVFGAMVADLSGLFDYRQLLGDPSATPSAFGALLGLEVLFSGFFFLAFIFAPRMVAEAEGSWRSWFARYLLFLGATIVSVTFLGGG
jgi:hypothetical protein